jgi:hypothetical protein
LKLDPGLYQKAERRARDLGYASVREYVVHLVERDADKPTAEAGDPVVTERLKGLGYL